jgi:trehalose 6-phosphate synthase/phosphatase
MASSTSRVVFQFTSNTVYGEKIRVTGNHENLGNWDPSRAPVLSTDSNSYPLWITTSPIVLPLNSGIEYKYIYTNGSGFRWEALQENRKLNLEHSSMIIEDDEGTLISRHIFNHSEVQSKPHNFESKKFSIDDSAKFSSSDPIIIASLNLPIKVTRNEKYDSSDPLSEKFNFESASGLWLPVLYEIAIQESINFQWVGWPHIFIEDESEQILLTSLLSSRYKCVPIFIPEETMLVYTQFCNGVLFPIFHNIISTDPESIPQYSSDQWESFKDVNSRIAGKIVELHTNQMIWIHDYQLLLTPSFVSRRTHEVVNLGLYLHVPFPSSEIYRVLPHREAILHAMLCCDMIGFHLFEYARHFLASCKRLLGIDHHFSRGGYLLLDYYGRNVMIRIGHLGIEPSVVQKTLESKEYLETLESLQKKYQNKSVLVAIDPLHRLSGITMKLNAFRQTLAFTSEFSDKLILVQLLFEAKNSSDKERDCVLQEILELRDQINKSYSSPVVEIVTDGITRPLRYAYMTLAKGVINSSIREGLYLIPFEFIFINKERPADIILSEFAGVSRALSSPKRVNPFDLTQLEGEIHLLIKPANNQNLTKRRRDYNYILNNTTLKWAQSSLTDLLRAKKDTKHFQYVTHGLGDKLKLIALNKKFKLLKSEEICEAYFLSRSRIFFFDNEGTLSNLCKQIEIDKSVGPSEKIINCLQDLCQDEKNTVYIVTGRTRKVLESWYGSVASLGMAAEYGALIKWHDKNDWDSIIQGTGAWKDTAKQIISAH